MTSRRVYHRDRDLQLGRAGEEFCGAWETIQALSRRKFLQAGAATAGGALLTSMLGVMGVADRAYADEAVKTGKFIFPRLQFSVKDSTPDRWNVGPVGDVNLRKQMARLTNVNVSMAPKVVKLGKFDEMCRHPFVFMTSEGYFDLPANEEKNFREYLDRGGFIMADDCVAYARHDWFFQDYRKLVDKLFPENPMRKIPLNHDIFRIYFDFKEGSPHMQGVKHGAHALFEHAPQTPLSHRRIMSYLDPGDLHCGWMCRYWGMGKNIQAIKMGVNVIVYFLSH
jgi:hypothetical protein